MRNVHCFTSFSYSYLSRALILVRTLKKAHPDWTVWALMVDHPPEGSDLQDALNEFDAVMFAHELGFKRFEAWLFKHDIVEACTAVKGQMLAHLLSQGADKVVYLDPDIAVFHPLDGILERLETNSIILTPHQIEANPNEGAVRDNELTSLMYGIYNLGFVAVRNDEAGRSFAQWWAKQLYFACYDEVHNGFFTDQKWCDLVPALFSNVYVERDPGCNVASWNLSTREISITRDGTILVNGSPLKFYHYTKINSAGDLMTEKYAGHNTQVLEVWNWYKRFLSTIQLSGIPKGYWYFDRFDNGVKIPKKVRVLFRSRSDLYDHFDHPFSTDEKSFYAWIRANEPHLLEQSSKDDIKGFAAI